MSPKCYVCGGSGKKSCQSCKGTGFIPQKLAKEKSKKKKPTPCPNCRGTGEVTCNVCGGTGRT